MLCLISQDFGFWDFGTSGFRRIEKSDFRNFKVRHARISESGSQDSMISIFQEFNIPDIFLLVDPDFYVFFSTSIWCCPSMFLSYVSLCFLWWFIWHVSIISSASFQRLLSSRQLLVIYKLLYFPFCTYSNLYCISSMSWVCNYRIRF